MDMNNIKSRQDLISYLAENNGIEFIFFWGHTAKNKSIVGKECLSQWYESEFTIENITYATAEHYMMAEKARLFSDETALNKILAASQAAEVKKIGRTVKAYDEQVWHKQRFEIVCCANEAKFGQSIVLKEFLLNTRARILVEASPYDKVWGVGMDVNHADIENPARWKGLNLLGFALMHVRAQLEGGGYVS